jgi:hypothetical protein
MDASGEGHRDWLQRRSGPHRDQHPSARGWGPCSLPVLHAPRCSLRGTSLPVVLAWWRLGGGIDEGATTVVSKRSRHRGSGGGEGVLAQRCWWRRRGPDSGSVHSRRFLDGNLAEAVCEGNKNWEVIQTERRVLNLYSKVSAGVLYGTVVEACISIVVLMYNRCLYFNISNDCTYEPLLMDYQQWFHVEPLLILFIRQIKNLTPFFPFFFLFL